MTKRLRMNHRSDLRLVSVVCTGWFVWCVQILVSVVTVGEVLLCVYCDDGHR